VAQRVPEAGLPQRPEQVLDPGHVGVDVGEDLARLQHPAAGRHADPLGAGGREDDFGDRGEKGVEPLGQRLAVESQGVQRGPADAVARGGIGVVEQEQDAVLAVVGQHALDALVRE
jgi:hypothetical protein